MADPLRLGEMELEALGFCPEVGVPFEGCIDSGTCTCPMKHVTRADLADYIREVGEDLATIRAGRGSA